MRSVRRFLAVLAAAALLTILASSSALGGDTKAKSVYFEKICPGIGPANPTCLVTTSTLRILRGATFHYLNFPSLFGPNGSPMLITTADANNIREGTANGVCHFNAATFTGHCEFAGGTGSLAGLHMDVIVVGINKVPTFTLTGTYYFSHGDGDEGDDD
jgi:hypothetical protein